MRHTRKNRSARGQGIVEYASVLAFTSCVIAMAFAIANGTLFAGISQSYSTINSTLDQTNQAAANHHP